MSGVIAMVGLLGLRGFGTSGAIDWWHFNVNTPISSTSHTVPFHIDTGETASQIGTDLYNLHLIRSTIAWDLFDRVTGAGPKFQAGSFVLNTNMSMSQIVSALQHGRPDEKTITFPEGFPIRYQAQLVDQKQIGTSPSYITGADYLKAAHDQAWASLYDFLPKQSNNPDYPFETSLFPYTYLVDPAAGARGLVKEQLDQFSAAFSAYWRAQIAQATAPPPAEDIPSIVTPPSTPDPDANHTTPPPPPNLS